MNWGDPTYVIVETIIDNNKMEQLYLEQLSPQERKAHDIAKSHLGTSFDIVRSNVIYG